MPEDLQTTGNGENNNHVPRILQYLPATHVINVTLSDSDPPEKIDFFVDAEDPDRDVLSYKWEVFDCADSYCRTEVRSTEKSYTYMASLPVKEIFVGVEISDSINNVYHYWIIRIQKQGF